MLGRDPDRKILNKVNPEESKMLENMFRLLSGESESARQRRELMEMGDHELADLGISRDQIEDFVRDHSEDED